ncbi:MAG: transporter substrate-binding domain-containing protein [Pseudomonadota bacterium]
MIALLPAAAQAQRTVRITNGEWPPYLSASLPEQGVLSHIVTLAFKQQGLAVEYGFFPWARAIMLAKVGEWDGSAAWARSPERERDFYFSDALVVSETVLYHLKSHPLAWSTVGDLAHYRIGVSRGYFYGAPFEAAMRDGTIQAENVTLDEMNLRKILGGRIDAFPVDRRVAEDLLRRHFSAADAALLTFHPKPLYIQTVHLMLSRAHPANGALMEQFNKGLKSLRESGQLDALLRQ